MLQENYKGGYGTMLINLILGAVCVFLLTVNTISRGFGIPVKSWPWLIGCYVATLVIQGFLYNSAKGLTK